MSDELKVGDTVQLRGGGGRYTVETITGGTAKILWHNARGDIMRQEMALADLEPFVAATSPTLLNPLASPADVAEVKEDAPAPLGEPEEVPVKQPLSPAALALTEEQASKLQASQTPVDEEGAKIAAEEADAEEVASIQAQEEGQPEPESITLPADSES